MKKTKDVTLSYLVAKEIVGAEEIIMRKSERDFSIQVTSEESHVLFLDAKDFRDRIIIPYPSTRHLLCENLETQEIFHEDLEENAVTFKVTNEATTHREVGKKIISVTTGRQLVTPKSR